jgi:formylmethanofuran dehydrogenase subunit A
MLTCIKGGRVIDPSQRRDGIGEVWIRDGCIVEPPTDGVRGDTVHDATGMIVMAGAIDIHSHIAGANVNTARLLLPEQHPAAVRRPDRTPLSRAGWSTRQTGLDYAKMGFTTVVEPAIAPHTALHAHLELADVPVIDKAILCVLGNDDYLLRLMRDKASAVHIGDYVAWNLRATRALGVKVINAGAAAAFKANIRSFSLDDIVPWYGVSSRDIVKTLQRAVIDLGLPHPLHVHCNNLGLAAGADTVIATIEAAEGLPLHLAHIQFYAYGTEGEKRFSSAAARLAESVNAHENITVDVGQVMFGQTVTISSDVTRQYSALARANPKKWAIIDGDSNGGGIVPYNYRKTDFHNAVQWAAGLELFLLIDDPSRVFFTTDHPNGAPYSAYPDLFALLMDRQLRSEWMATLPPAAMAMTTLASIDREYTLAEIATMTRAAPARLLGLNDRGRLTPGARADVAVYVDQPDRAAMFRNAAMVFKDGDLVVCDGRVKTSALGHALTVDSEVDAAIEARMRDYYEQTVGLDSKFIKVPGSALGVADPFEVVSCRR